VKLKKIRSRRSAPAPPQVPLAQIQHPPLAPPQIHRQSAASPAPLPQLSLWPSDSQLLPFLCASTPVPCGTAPQRLYAAEKRPPSGVLAPPPLRASRAAASRRRRRLLLGLEGWIWDGCVARAEYAGRKARAKPKKWSARKGKEAARALDLGAGDDSERLVQRASLPSLRLGARE
jgi:hypothetical protein